MSHWRLGKLADRDRVAESLGGAGAAAAERFAGAADELLLQGIPPATEAVAFFVPGRLELLGKHTDYAGGRGLVAATRQGLAVVATRRDDGVLRIDDVGRECSVASSPPRRARPLAGHWTRPPLTVARRLAADFPGGPRGAQIAFSSDLPAAGLGGSSALLVAVYLALARLGALAERPEHGAVIQGDEGLAAYLSAVEGDPGLTDATAGETAGETGAQSLTAILRAEPQRFRQYRYRPIRWERSVPMPEGHLLAVAASGVPAQSVDRERRARPARLAERACQAWRDATGRDDRHLGALIEGAPNAVARMRELLRTHAADDELEARFEHFVAESSEIVPAAGDALEHGDLVSLGRLVDHSQQLAERLLGNQVPETIFLARSARESGALAASAFGAGFGGAVWALIAAEGSDDWLAGWAERYECHYPDRAEGAAFLLTAPGPAAREVLPADAEGS